MLSVGVLRTKGAQHSLPFVAAKGMTVYYSFKVFHAIAAGISAGQDINALDSLARGLKSEKNGASGRSLFLFGAGFAAGATAYYLYATREGEGRSDSSEVT